MEGVIILSDIVLIQGAQQFAKERVKEMIKEYNDPELTPKGKLEVLENTLFKAFLEAYNLGKDSVCSKF